MQEVYCTNSSVICLGEKRQVLSIVMSMVQKSKIVLLDEITTALYPESAEAFMKWTHRMVCEPKLTCILITHNIMHTIEYGHRLLLKNGSFIKEYDTKMKSKLTPSKLTVEFGET
jgi:putative ABC transport system ATP-binding protein